MGTVKKDKELEKHLKKLDAHIHDIREHVEHLDKEHV